MGERTTRPCRHCGELMELSGGPGRPRLYCTNQCRQRDYERRVIFNGVTIQTLGERDGWRCYLCGDLVDPEVKSGWDAPSKDHIIPTILGGQTVEENLALVHVRCNTLKGTRIIPHPSWDAA